jgi:hypothetical protein
MKQLFIHLVLLGLLPTAQIPGQPHQAEAAAQAQVAKIETSYDSSKDRTTVKLVPVKISGEKGVYYSMHMAPWFSFPGRQVQTPSIVFFEVQTVVKKRLLDSDLYVDFLIDGEKIFLSSQNRYAVKHPVRGRLWMGEVLIFRMPYEIFVKLTKANEVAMRFDGVVFSIGQTEREELRELLASMDSEN